MINKRTIHESFMKILFFFLIHLCEMPRTEVTRPRNRTLSAFHDPTCFYETATKSPKYMKEPCRAQIRYPIRQMSFSPHIGVLRSRLEAPSELHRIRTVCKRGGRCRVCLEQLPPRPAHIPRRHRLPSRPPGPAPGASARSAARMLRAGLLPRLGSASTRPWLRAAAAGTRSSAAARGAGGAAAAAASAVHAGHARPIAPEGPLEVTRAGPVGRRRLRGGRGRR